MISIKTRHILLMVATVVMFAIPAIGNASWCTGADEGKFDYGSGCVALPTPDDTLAALTAGNLDYVSGDTSGVRDFSTSTERTAQYSGQKPNAIVLTCSDSRVPPEILFSKGLGQIFTVRVAGNVVAEHEIGSIEYAIEHLGANLIVVLGHERCGAVKTTYDVHGTDTTHLGPNLNSLVDSIDPAVTAVLTAAGGKPSTATAQAAQVESCVVENTKRVTASLETKSLIIKEFVELGRIKIIQGKYDLDDGLVTFSAAPTPKFINVPATSNSGNFTVSWSEVNIPNAEYTLEVYDSVPALVNTIHTTNTYVEFTGVANGTYTYRVKAAKSGFNEGDWKNSTPITVSLAPAAPANIAVPASSSTGSITVFWSQSNVAGVTYTLQYSFNSGAWTPAYSGANTTASFSGLAAGSYVYRVGATMSGLPTVWKSSTPCVVSTIKCNKPTSIKVPATNSTGSFNVYWPQTNVAGATYNVEVTSDGGSNWNPVAGATATANTSVTVTGLTNGTYSYRVNATVGAYTTAWTQSGTCVVSLKCNAPTSLIVPATVSNGGSFTAYWPQTNVAGATYDLEVSSDGGSNWNPVAGATDTLNTNASITGMTTGSYIYRVRASITGYDSAWKQSRTVTVP